jgi:hypothetical protein
MSPAEYEIAPRAPGESADHYLNRITEETRIRTMAIKEKGRIERRIRSNVERVIIERAVRDGLKRPVVKARGPVPADIRIPRGIGPVGLLFMPLILLSVIIIRGIARGDI